MVRHRSTVDNIDNCLQAFIITIDYNAHDNIINLINIGLVLK